MKTGIPTRPAREHRERPLTARLEHVAKIFPDDPAGKLASAQSERLKRLAVEVAKIKRSK